MDILSSWDELKKLPEHQTLEKIRHFRISIEIFNGNYNELIHYLQIHNDPLKSLQMMDIDKRHLLHAYQREIARFLHNFIASALSLTDHARNHYKELYANNNSFPDYKEEINNRFLNNPLANFIKELRQYIQHYEMPNISSRVRYTGNPPSIDISIVLPTKELLKFSGWHKLSKEFLNEQTDDIDLIAVINDYYKLIESFYSWFLERQFNIHKNDTIKVEAQINKIRGLELSQFLIQFFKKPTSIEDFELQLFRLFPEEELVAVKHSITLAERVTNILELMKKTQNPDQETTEYISKLYKS